MALWESEAAYIMGIAKLQLDQNHQDVSKLRAIVRQSRLVENGKPFLQLLPHDEWFGLPRPEIPSVHILPLGSKRFPGASSSAPEGQGAQRAQEVL